jgi:chaperonin GroES
MQTIKPAPDQLFVKPLEATKKTHSGFFLADAAIEKPRMAEVVNVGSRVANFQSGDQIIYKSYAVTEVKVNGDDYMLVAEEDILGTVLDVKE